MTQTESVIIANKGAEVAVCCLCLSCYCILLDKSGSLALQRAWRASRSSSWLPSQSALPTGRRLAHCCHFSPAPAIVAGDGRVGKQRERSAGCWITPVSAARRDVKSAVGLPVSCKFICRQWPLSHWKLLFTFFSLGLRTDHKAQP